MRLDYRVCLVVSIRGIRFNAGRQGLDSARHSLHGTEFYLVVPGEIRVCTNALAT